MRCETLTAAAAVLLMLIAGCPTLERMAYRPDINQGNYPTLTGVIKVRTSMMQQQVTYTLGIPMMSGSFGINTRFYMFRQQPDYEGATQQTLTLISSSSGILTDIDNKPASTDNK